MTPDLKFDFEETIRLLAAGLCEREQTKTEDDISLPGYGKGSFYADDYYSGYLCGSCLIEGMSVEKEPAAIYGDEPCYSLIKGNPKYTCPFFNGCPVTRMQCEALTASVVITIPQGLAQAKVGLFTNRA